MAETPKPYSITNDVWMVPCSVSTNNKQFKPICKPFPEVNNDLEGLKNTSWTPDEDKILASIVILKNKKTWSAISKEINNKVHNYMNIRNGKQCRERWANHLDPNLNREPWSNEEDEIIVMKQIQSGNKWSDISKLLLGRTENQVKNRWKSLLAKAKRECPPNFRPNEYIITMVKTKIAPESKNDNLVLPVFISPNTAQYTYSNYVDMDIPIEEYGSPVRSLSLPRSDDGYIIPSRSGSGRLDLDFFPDLSQETKFEDGPINNCPSFTSDCSSFFLSTDMLMGFKTGVRSAYQSGRLDMDSLGCFRSDSGKSDIDNLLSSFTGIDCEKKDCIKSMAMDPNLNVRIREAEFELANLLPK
ncbi:hypothetical protein SteCoe_6386 [Stentor coeruleus]|uniref:Myb-like DNA-binding domain containing protein n=1 Tax=Stentor coeruleus TaxID=5963 RepID=A0A1R2CQ45_9CILI|nr:hypothetical protein SteCoe_6386 [Stentor coeruleus]